MNAPLRRFVLFDIGCWLCYLAVAFSARSLHEAGSGTHVLLPSLENRMHHDTTTRDTEAVVTTLLANHRRFLSFLEARVGSPHDAEEILQNAFVRSLQKAGEIRDSENAVAWFYRLLRNAVVDYYRSNSANGRSLETFARQLSESDEHADPAVERVICECVGELVSVLKPEDADLITRVDLQGADVTSVADLLGITPGNARVRLHRARAALRHEVERTCRTCATHGCLDCTCSTREVPGVDGSSPC